VIVRNSVWVYSRKAECMLTMCNIVPNSVYNISFIKCVYRVSNGIMSMLFPEVIPSQKYHIDMRSVHSVTELCMFEIEDAMSSQN
jgi:hypothetical protein